MVTLTRIGLVALISLAGQAALACSGVGAPLAMSENARTTFLAFIVGCLAAAFSTWLLYWRRQDSIIPLANLVILALSGAAILGSGSGGDCGATRMFISVALSCLVGVSLCYTLFARRFKRQDVSPHLGLVALVVLFVAAAIIGWFMPWKLRPLPAQRWYLIHSPFVEFKATQAELFKQTGSHAKTMKDLSAIQKLEVLTESEGDTGEHHRWKHRFQLLKGREPGSTSWAVIALPVEWPHGGDWKQFLLLSDGRVFSRDDPGNASYLIEVIPAEPYAEGWEEDGYFAEIIGG